MEQTTGTSPDAAATAATPATDVQPDAAPAGATQADAGQTGSAQTAAAPPAGAEPKAPDTAGFGARGRIRRRMRFLRKARELAYRDLGGLVYSLHRFGQRNDQLVLAKLTLLGQIDHELRTLEGAIGEPRPTTILREAGVTVCARCAAIHSSEDRYCPNCGLSLGRHPDLPIAGAAAAGTPAPPAAAGPGAPAHSAPSPPGGAPGAAGPPPMDPAGPPAVPPAPAAPSPSPYGGRSPDPPTKPHPAPGRDEDTEIIRPPSSRP